MSTLANSSDLNNNDTQARFPGHLDLADGKVLLESVFDYSDIMKLGSGSFGTAFSVSSLSDKQSKVCKMFLFGRDVNISSNQYGVSNRHKNLYNQFLTEASLYKQMSHANIVQFHDCFQLYSKDQDEWNIVKVDSENNKLDCPQHRLLMCGLLIEKMEMSLLDWLTKHQVWQMSEQFIREMFLQIGSALAYLHMELHTCHNDLKEDNIGVVCDLGPDCLPHLKLYDFGNAKQYTEEFALRKPSPPSQAKQYVIESYLFANLLIKLMSNEQQVSVNFGHYRQSFLLKSIQWKDQKLRAILLKITSPFEEFSINQALEMYRG